MSSSLPRCVVGGPMGHQMVLTFVLIGQQGIDDLCAKVLVDAGCVGVRRVDPEDLRRVAAATGAKILPNLADLEGEESFDSANLGEADDVTEDRVGDGELIFIHGSKTERATSIVLRGANEFMLDEVHRSLHDAMWCVGALVLGEVLFVVLTYTRAIQRCATRVGEQVDGLRRRRSRGGARDAPRRLCHDCRHSRTACHQGADRSRTCAGDGVSLTELMRGQEFAEALLVIPKTLAVNAAKDATDLVAKLCSYHHTAQTVVRCVGMKMSTRCIRFRNAYGWQPAKESYKFFGLDLRAGEVCSDSFSRQ